MERLHLHSEEIQDIIGQAPKNLTKWGITIFLSVLLLLFSLSYIVKYADTVQGTFTLAAQDGPKAIVSRVAGKLTKIFATEGQEVKKGDIIAYLESTADHAEVIRLSTEIEHIWQQVLADRWGNISIEADDYRSLGEMQGAFQAFFSSYTQIHILLNKGVYAERMGIIKRELDQNLLTKNILLRQKDIYQKDYQLALTGYKANHYLYDEKIIAPLEFNMEESKILNKKLPMENMELSLANNISTSLAKKRELLELKSQLAELKFSFEQALSKLSSDLEDWRKKYLVLSPIDGIVTFPGIIQENQDVHTGDDILYIIPFTSGYHGLLLIDQHNFGKVDTGQTVIIRLESFPFQEYGRLTGIVSYISSMPTKNGQFIVKVDLPNGLLTDAGHYIRFSNGLIADAEIVTSKTRLINKFLYSIKRVINSR